jgi:apolipoprotein N-acyltransferase
MPAARTIERDAVARVLALGAGAALAASMPSLDWTPLAWVGLVPLVWAVEGRGPARAFRLGWLTGVAFWLCTTYWIVHTIGHYTAVPMPVAAAILCLMAGVLACYHGAFAAGLVWMRARRLPVLWLAPALWVVLEWMRGWFFIGFPWADLGYSQHRFLDLVQMVEVTGVYGVSAVVVLVNVLVARVVVARGAALARQLPALAAVTVLVVVLPIAGRARRHQLAALPPAGHVTIGVTQGNVDQARKWDPAFQAETLARYDRLTRAAAAAGAELIAWPETAAPFFFQQPGPERDAVLALARDTDTWLLIGSPAAFRRVNGGIAQTNRAYLIGPHGFERDFYDKMRLVPFGEYVPYKRILFFVDRIVTAVGGIVPGRRATIFKGPDDSRFGALICYEGIFPDLSRHYVAEGATFLVNVTNDAWYGATSAPAQHLVQASFRAIENRVPMARAANTGISALIAADGTITWQSALDVETWHVGELTWPGVRTFYTRFGDVFVWLCVVATLGAFAVGLRRRTDAG